jgi:hypothetical protein
MKLRYLIITTLMILIAGSAPAQSPQSPPSHMDVVPGSKIDGFAPVYLHNPSGPMQFISAGSLATAAGLTVPPGTAIVEICVETAGVRYRDDGAQFFGSISGTTLTVKTVTLGTIAIGQAVGDRMGNISAGTTITGGSGLSWTVNNSQTTANEIIFAGTAPTALVGIPIVASASAPFCWQYDGPSSIVRFIAISGSPTMDIGFYYQN